MDTDLRADYLTRANGDYLEAALLFAEALARGDWTRHQAGYSVEAAILAAEEMFPDAGDDDLLGILNIRSQERVLPLLILFRELGDQDRDTFERLIGPKED